MLLGLSLTVTMSWVSREPDKEEGLALNSVPGGSAAEEAG